MNSIALHSLWQCVRSWWRSRQRRVRPRDQGVVLPLLQYTKYFSGFRSIFTSAGPHDGDAPLRGGGGGQLAAEGGDDGLLEPGEHGGGGDGDTGV